MAGLLDFLSTPSGMGLLSAAAGGMATARRGQPWNTAGRGAIAGLTGYQAANDQLRQNDENALTKQYRQMQMQKIEQDLARQKQMQESLQSLYKPAGTMPYQGADNPFGEDLGNLQTETPATFGGKPVDPVMAAVLPYAQPDDIMKMVEKRNNPAEQFGKIMPHSYTPESLSAYQQSGNYSDLKPIGNGAEFGKVNPGQFTPESLARYAETGQFGDLVQFRSPTQIDQGGTKTLYDPGTGRTQSYAVTPKPTDMPEFQAAQETAKVSARETVQRGVEAEGLLPKVQASAANARAMVQGVLDHPGFSSTVGVTALPGARFVPGTKEADFMSRVDQLKGSAFLQAFETLKGGGQITEVEGKKATDAINRMSISTSEAEFKAAAADFLSVVDRAEQNAVRAATKGQTKPAGTLTRGEILNVELQDAITKGDTRNANHIRDEMRRLGVKATGAAKQEAGTFKSPIRVTNDADYNNVPKGKYYQAPDGSIRIRK